mmetsp:Transcript_17979/g.44867  ORF Transcript_17979/g.44867 Transcript_17979/m.44867 type:complete len:230 (-) Transcript_17979:365-1054(-)
MFVVLEQVRFALLSACSSARRDRRHLGVPQRGVGRDERVASKSNEHDVAHGALSERLRGDLLVSNRLRGSSRGTSTRTRTERAVPSIPASLFSTPGAWRATAVVLLARIPVSTASWSTKLWRFAPLAALLAFRFYLSSFSSASEAGTFVGLARAGALRAGFPELPGLVVDSALFTGLFPHALVVHHVLVPGHALARVPALQPEMQDGVPVRHRGRARSRMVQHTGPPRT